MGRVLIVIAVLAVAAGQAWPCSCKDPGPPRHELERSVAVFSGTAVAVDSELRRVGGPPGTKSTADLLKWRFLPDRIWKGAIAETLYVYTARSTAACGYAFNPGDRYLVYAMEVGPRRAAKFEWPAQMDTLLVETGLCTRTHRMSEDDADLLELPAPAWTRKARPGPAGD